MKIMVTGSGGREHALAWRASLSKSVSKVFVAPGNAGSVLEENIENVAIDVLDFDAQIEFAQREGVALTIIGPEVPLAAGAVDAFTAAGLRCLGPSRRAAELEGSKSFCKAFMARHGIPTAAYQVFEDAPSAVAFAAEMTPPIVIKADGLAAGKGVILAASHAEAKVVIEDMLGFSYDKPARHMREYLQVLAPLLRGEQVAFNGEEYRVNLGLNVPDAGHVPLLVAALGPVMLKLTGEVADGTVTWMTGPETLENHIIPKLGAGASAAGKPSPATVAGFPVTLTNDVDAGRKHVGETLAMYGTLPSYRAMLDREGVAGPADLALVGDEAQLRQELSRLKNIGVTHFCAAISGETEEVRERTSQFLSAEA